MDISYVESDTDKSSMEESVMNQSDNCDDKNEEPNLTSVDDNENILFKAVLPIFLIILISMIVYFEKIRK